MKLKRFLTLAVKIFVTGLLLAMVFRNVDPARIRQDLAQLEAGRLGVLLVIYWIGQLLCAQRWRLFALSLGLRQSFGTFFQLYFAGMFFNVGLPSVVGGDFVKAYMIARKTGAPLHSGLASIFQDRAVGLISLLAFGSAAAAFYSIEWRGVPLWLIYLVIWSGVAAILWLVWKGEGAYRRHRIPGSSSSAQKVLALLSDFHQALGTMRLPARAAVQVTAISFLNSGLVLWVFHQVTVAAGYPVNPIAFFALFPLITLVTLLPISIGGIGIREWTYVQALSLVGIPPEVALTIALASSALLIISELAGVFFLPAIPAELRSKT